MFLQRLDRSAFPGSETIPATETRGRVTSDPVYAKISSPHFHAAAMDGFAVKAEDTFGAGPETPVRFTVDKTAWPVNTGRPIPSGTDAVIMIEDVNFPDEETFEIEQALAPWQHVRRVGEDFVATEMILPARRLITAYDVGAFLAGGVYSVDVAEKPKVVLIPTGSELISPEILTERDPAWGETVEFNSVMLGGLAEQAGARVERLPIIQDEYDDIKKAVADAVQSDAHMVVINAGSSAGSEDYTYSIIDELGEVLVHGVAMMPGKPTVLGVIDGKPVIGNPGYPVSAVLSFETFCIPVIEAMLGLRHSGRLTVPAETIRKIPSKLGREEFFRVKLGRVGERIVAAPLPRGAGSITTLTKADGILRIPSQSEGIDQGSTVQVEILRSRAEIERTVVVIGSHDLTLDILADELITHDVYVSSSHVGSLGGILALKNGSAHVATSHLLDAETGLYNWSYIDKYLPEVPVKLIHGVMREQGFMVPKGNPKGIKGFEDLTREDVHFVNRQAGAGTRVLLDYYLDKLGIEAERITGYDLEEYTHTTVAVAVVSGVADVGMGVLAAARALDLDFIPVATEQYDLIIPEHFMEDERIVKMLEVMTGSRFKERVEALGGYGTDITGTILTPP